MASPQVLTAFTALSATVVPSDANTLSGDMTALSNLGFSDLKAVEIVCLIALLNGYTGTNYTSNHAQLIQDAKSFMGGFSLIYREEPEIVTQMQTALTWGSTRAKVAGSISTDVWSLLATGKDFRCLPLETLNKIIFFLRYKLALLSV